MKKDWVKDPTLLADAYADLDSYWAGEDAFTDLCLKHYHSRPYVQLNNQAQSVLEIALGSAVVNSGWNLTLEIADTAKATVARPLHGIVLPVGADNQMQRNCRVVTRLSDGIDENCDFEDISGKIFDDGCTTPIGVLRGKVVDGEIVCERVLPKRFRVLPGEKDTPRHFFISTPMPRDEVIEEYPTKKEDIKGAPGFTDDDIAGVDPLTSSNEDMVLVIEAWKVKVGNKKGRYVKVVGKVVLADEEYDVTWPPLAFFRWKTSNKHFYGRSLASIVAPFHLQVDRAIDQLNRSFEAALPHVVSEENSITQLPSDEAMSQITYKPGTASPRIEKTEPASEQLIRWIPDIRARAFAVVGVSEMIASSTRPQGLDSEPSQLAWVDIANIRSQYPARNWQNFYKQWMRVKLSLAATTYAEKGARVMAPGTKLIDEIKWPVDLDEDKYQYRVAVKSALSLTVSGRMQELETLKKLLPTQLTEADIARYLGLTDVEKATDRANAEMDTVEYIIDQCLVEGEGQIPSEIMGNSGLENLVRVGRQAYLNAIGTPGKYPPANIELLRRVILAAQDVLTAKAPAPAPNPTMPGAPALPIDPLAPPVTPPVPPIPQPPLA